MPPHTLVCRPTFLDTRLEVRGGGARVTHNLSKCENESASEGESEGWGARMTHNLSKCENEGNSGGENERWSARVTNNLQNVQVRMQVRVRVRLGHTTANTYMA